MLHRPLNQRQYEEYRQEQRRQFHNARSAETLLIHRVHTGSHLIGSWLASSTEPPPTLTEQSETR